MHAQPEAVARRRISGSYTNDNVIQDSQSRAHTLTWHKCDVGRHSNIAPQPHTRSLCIGPRSTSACVQKRGLGVRGVEFVHLCRYILDLQRLYPLELVRLGHAARGARTKVRECARRGELWSFAKPRVSFGVPV